MKNLDAFGNKLKEPTREIIESLLNPKPKRIRRGKFNLIKIYGPDTYINIGKQIERDGLLKPTMAEVASLVYDLFVIKKIKETKQFWAFTGTLYVPNKGAYIQDDPKIKGGEVFMEESDLEKKLQENNKSVRFVPFGYKTGWMFPSDLEKNEYFIALAGEEGAKKLAEAAGKWANPCLSSWGTLNESPTRVTAVSSSWYQGNYGLSINCNIFADSDRGYSFGMEKG